MSSIIMLSYALIISLVLYKNLFICAMKFDLKCDEDVCLSDHKIDDGVSGDIEKGNTSLREEVKSEYNNSLHEEDKKRNNVNDDLKSSNALDIFHLETKIATEYNEEIEKKRFHDELMHNTPDTLKQIKDSKVEEKEEDKHVLQNRKADEEITQLYDNYSDVTTTLPAEFSEGSSTTYTPTSSSNSTTPIGTVTPNTTENPLPPTVAPSKDLLDLEKNSSLDFCLCDLTIDECDINCCCDEDCTYTQRQVFTECKDFQSIYDSNYCYRTNFFFKNNTKYIMMENENSLFCIVRDNLPSRLRYDSKPLIKEFSDFHKKIRKNRFYSFGNKELFFPNMTSVPYHAGDLVWTLQNTKLIPLGIPTFSIGLRCTGIHSIRYLVDSHSECSRKIPRTKNELFNSKGLDMTFYYKSLKIISSPVFANLSELKNISQFCKNESCVNVTFYVCNQFQTPTCSNKGELLPTLSNGVCLNVVKDVKYFIYHNGTDGIREVKAYFWLKNISTSNNLQLLQRFSVKFRWVGTPEKVFERSGNPGYIVGKPIMAGRKVYSSQTDNAVPKKEAIELSFDSNDWLSTFGILKGKCSNTRIPILFRENAYYMCSIRLLKEDLEKGNCLDLQKRFFDLLIGDDFTNISSSNFFNKFVATYGNSKVEETGDWVQILIDLFPIISSQVSFKKKTSSVVCKNIITGLLIDVAYSNIGSFSNPQAKILGVSFQFTKAEDLIFDCGMPDCRNSGVSRSFSLSTSINFIDLTDSAVPEFAKPPSLEAKLPHDFFYPFFSRGSSIPYFPKKLIICTVFSTTLFYKYPF